MGLAQRTKQEFNDALEQAGRRAWLDAIFLDVRDELGTVSGVPTLGTHLVPAPIPAKLDAYRRVEVFDVTNGLQWGDDDEDRLASAATIGDSLGDVLVRPFVRASWYAAMVVIGGARLGNVVPATATWEPLYSCENENIIEASGPATPQVVVDVWPMVEDRFRQLTCDLDVPSGPAQYVVIVPTNGVLTLIEARARLGVSIVARATHHPSFSLGSSWFVFRTDLGSRSHALCGIFPERPQVTHDSPRHLEWTARVGIGWLDHRTTVRMDFS